MSSATASTPDAVPLPSDLNTVLKVGLLAWLIPGAGHWYMGRRAKALIFFVCILGTFFYGIALGGSRTVYASMRTDDKRLVYLLQFFSGAPALPAIVQSVYTGQKGAPLANGFMAPPVLIGQLVPTDWAEEQMRLGPEAGDFRPGDFLPSALPGYHYYKQPVRPDDPNYRAIVDHNPNQYSIWQNKYDFKYDLGVLFTSVAGLLNLLVILDAVGGPALGRTAAEFLEKVAQHKTEQARLTEEKKAAKVKSPTAKF